MDILKCEVRSERLSRISHFPHQRFSLIYAAGVQLQVASGWLHPVQFPPADGFPQWQFAEVWGVLSAGAGSWVCSAGAPISAAGASDDEDESGTVGASVGDWAGGVPPCGLPGSFGFILLITPFFQYYTINSCAVKWFHV